jgi:hypothetical protein
VAGRRAGGGGDRGGRGHTDSHVTGASRSGYDARCRIEEIRCKKSSTASENDGFPAFSAAGGNNNTKRLYFPFCLDHAPLTWLESLEKYSIDKWDQLKEQFTSKFAGAMGRSGTRMDLLA